MEASNKAKAHSEKRKERRSPAIGSPLYLCTVNDVKECRLQGITADVSDSGISFYSSHTFRNGTELNLLGTAIGDVPRKAVVKRCVMINKGIFRVGVSFK